MTCSLFSTDRIGRPPQSGGTASCHPTPQPRLARARLHPKPRSSTAVFASPEFGGCSPSSHSARRSRSNASGSERRARTPRRPLRIHAYRDLLVLYWQHGQAFPGDITILLDNEPLPKPWLGVEIKEKSGVVIVALVKGIENRKNFDIRILAATGRELAEASCRKGSPLPKTLTNTWSLPSRIRVERALLVEAERLYPQLSRETKYAIAASLTESDATVLHGPEGWLYGRLPWPDAAEPGQMGVTLKALDADGRTAHVEPVRALLEGGRLHFFASEASPHCRSDRLWVLEAGKLRCAPILIPRPTGAPDQLRVDSWLDRCAASCSTNPTLLKAFASTVLTLR